MILKKAYSFSEWLLFIANKGLSFRLKVVKDAKASASILIIF